MENESRSLVNQVRSVCILRILLKFQQNLLDTHGSVSLEFPIREF